MSDAMYNLISQDGENIIKSLIADVAKLKASDVTLPCELGTPDIVTILGGVIVLPKNCNGYVRVETQGGAASDDLDEIQGGVIGKIIVLEAYDSTHTVVVKNAVTNLTLAGSDFSLDDARDKIMLIKNRVADWDEISRSNNA